MNVPVNLATTVEPVLIYPKDIDAHAQLDMVALTVKKKDLTAETTPVLNVLCAKMNQVSITLHVYADLDTLESTVI